jgi:hypothetical protein
LKPSALLLSPSPSASRLKPRPTSEPSAPLSSQGHRPCHILALGPLLSNTTHLLVTWPFIVSLLLHTQRTGGKFVVRPAQHIQEENTLLDRSHFAC